ncbi:class I SAM-dependent methyltransferase [Pelagibacteraceae bacterium]|nr:class I SAM-dependent methyltransferase [Pelagibacteraceae bacterium]|tara:strand:- start:115 stop:879 length:765 start_codon:yes stop_codon:yes gene_type:complete
MIFKTKNFPRVYSIKIKIREFKFLLKTIFYFYIIKTPQNLINNFLKNSILHSRLRKKDINNYTPKKNYIFSDNDWFFEKLPLFIEYFNKNQISRNVVKKVLEIGSYEGRSSVFFLEYFNLNSLTAVDTWEGSPEHGEEIKNRMKDVENNFDHNVVNFKGVIKHKTTSDSFFRSDENTYDLILIDGSHEGTQVAKDLENSFNCLNKQGYILSDDYDYTFYDMNNNVAKAFNNFYLKNINLIKIIYIYRQILIQKI